MVENEARKIIVMSKELKKLREFLLSSSIKERLFKLGGHVLNSEAIAIIMLIVSATVAETKATPITEDLPRKILIRELNIVCYLMSFSYSCSVESALRII